MSRPMVPLLLTLSIALAASNHAQANVLNNAGFEDPLGFDFSVPTNWNGFFGGPAGVILEAFNDTGAPPNSGVAALELTLDGVPGTTNGTNSFVGHVQSVPGISAGDPIEASVFARNNDSQLTGNVEFRVEFLNAANGEISRVQLNLEGLLTNEYQQFSFDAVAPVDTVSANLVLAIASFNQDVLHSNSVLFDDASLTIVPEPSTLLLLGLSSLGLVGLRRR